MTKAQQLAHIHPLEPRPVADHPAGRASQCLGNYVAPTKVQVLKETARSRIFRLSGSCSVIAKRMGPTAASIERLVTTEILPKLAIPTPNFLGETEQVEGGFIWMFFEDWLDAPFDDETHGKLGAAWVARLHGAAAKLDRKAKLPKAGVPRAFRDLQSP